MKVKFIGKEDYLWLEYWKVYNIFAIAFWNEGWEKYYIKTKWPKYVYPMDISDFEIVDNSLSKFWTFWKSKLWNYYIWPEELYSLNKYFWEDYYNDDKECVAIIDNYLKIAREDLFNE